MLKTQITGLFIKGFWNALDWVYPPACAICGMPGYSLCLDCEKEIQHIRGKICVVCGNPICRKEIVCNDCQERKPAYDGVRNLAFYGGVIRECIHALKYGNNQGLGKYFAERLKPIVEEAWEIDLVLPVPLSRERLRERGYNQAAAVAHPLAGFLHRPFTTYGLKQIRDTRSQVGLSAEARLVNVIDAFVAVPELVSDKNILLVDDVMTTGATLGSCARALKDAGGKKVYCVTIARFSRRIHL